MIFICRHMSNVVRERLRVSLPLRNDDVVSVAVQLHELSALERVTLVAPYAGYALGLLALGLLGHLGLQLWRRYRAETVPDRTPVPIDRRAARRIK